MAVGGTNQNKEQPEQKQGEDIGLDENNEKGQKDQNGKVKKKGQPGRPPSKKKQSGGRKRKE